MVRLQGRRRQTGAGVPATILPTAWSEPLMSAATRNCPETATKLPAGGHENCPLTVMGSARHDVVRLTVLRG
jgi:hypothetical protein